MANLYSTSGLSFLPTVSPEHIKNGDSTEDYFKAFVLKNPFGTITDDNVQVYDGGMAYLHTGMYTFELGDAGSRTPVAARFSYMWRKEGNDWKITHHHSSVVPAASNEKVLDVARVSPSDVFGSKVGGSCAPDTHTACFSRAASVFRTSDVGVQQDSSHLLFIPILTHVIFCMQSNFKRWNDALQTKNPKSVANLYDSSNLSFLPTVSPKHITGRGSTEDYFTDFVMKNPFGVITDDSVQSYEDGKAYLHTGLYTFELGEGAARAPVQARFSYMWRKVGDDWKITHHHSSVRPAGPDMNAIARVCHTHIPDTNTLSHACGAANTL